MSLTLQTEVKFLKGVGPQRAAVLASRGLHTVGDLLSYLPFRYEDRIHFSEIREIVPGGTYTMQGTVADCGLARFTRGRRRDLSPARRGRHRPSALQIFSRRNISNAKSASARASASSFTARPISIRCRAGRVEMINPQFELLGADTADSTEVGRIVPIYEAIGAISSRMIRRMIHAALENLIAPPHRSAARRSARRYGFPARRDALRFVHFPPPDMSVETLNEFRSPAHRRLIFEEFFFYQLSLALRAPASRAPARASPSACASRAFAKPLKRILPFKPTEAQKRVLAEIAADLERPVPMNRLLEGDVGSGKTIVALEAAAIVIENGYQVALMAPTEILAVQHFLSARRIFARAGYAVELLISGLKPAEKRAAAERVRTGEAQARRRHARAARRSRRLRQARPGRSWTSSTASACCSASA